MSIIRTVPEAEATGEVAELYAADLDELGYVPPHTRAMAMNPQALQAFQQLIRSVVPTLGLRGYELVTLAAARGTRSAHCRLAHGAKVLARGLFDEDQLTRIAIDYADAGLSDAEVEMMRYAEKVASDSRSMTDADGRRLRDAGFSDREIVDITIAAAARLYFGAALQALAVDVDVPPTLGAATVGALDPR